MSSYKVRSASGDILAYYSTDASQNISIERIKQEIDNTPVINPKFRFHILNEDETIREDIPEEDIIMGGTYNENYQNGQRRSISISLFNYTGKYTPSINGLWVGVKISFDMGLEINGVIIWFKKGVYVISSISPSHEPGTTNVSVELSDKFAVLEGATGTFETSYTVPVGNDIQEVIQDLLNLQRGNGQVIDPKPIIYNSKFKGAKIQAEISKQAGETIGSIIIDIATQLNAEVFYDVEGNLTFVPINDVTGDEDKPVIYHFYDENGDIFNNNLSFDLSGAINRVIVIGSTVNSNVIIATSVNDNVGSPLCYQRIGYRTASPINDSNITTEILAQERADYELRQHLILKSSASNGVRYNPLLSVNNLIGVTDSFYGFNQERFLLQSISCPIDYSGSMSITSANIQNFGFLTTRR